MEQISEIRAFVAVGEGLSFAAAARRLGASAPQISKLVARLEGHLGARLLNRTTRAVSLTDAGQAYLERARILVEEYDALQESVRSLGAPAGLVRISAPIAFGAWQLQATLLDFASAHPKVTLEVSFTDRLINLVEEGVDLGVRIARLTDSSLIARKLAPVRIVTCAAPDYLKREGIPATPHDLAAREAILDLNVREPALWHFGRADEITVRVDGRLRFASPFACVAAARAGFGITRAPAFAAAEDLREGRLATILADYESEPLSVYAVYPHARHLAPKVRVLVDFLAEHFAGEPEWHRGWS